MEQINLVTGSYNMDRWFFCQNGNKTANFSLRVKDVKEEIFRTGACHQSEIVEE